ncbi:MAG TPA: uroporphyrinogen-III synthase [Sphingomicrobium sp.]|nr:uroporphyrinogen-III synthase [Sphingomicrobium sp.]
MRRLVILRPEPGATASLDRARTLGLDAIAMPLFGIHPLAWTPPDRRDFDAVLATSANALRYGGGGLEQFHHLPLYAVGAATADAARDARFNNVVAGSGNVDELLRAIPPKLRLFHPCGRDHRDLNFAPQRIVSVPVYAAEALPVPEGLAAIVDAVVAVHSPRAGRRLAELADAAGIDRSMVWIAAISEAAAVAAGTGWAEVASAAEPNDAALLELAARLCEKPQP